MVRVTAQFFLIGAALLVGEQVLDAWEQPEPRVLEVELPASLTANERRVVINESILVEEALRLGWLESDPAIRRRLVRNMRFIDGMSDERQRLQPAQERELFRRALELGMERTDPVVRRRLLARVDRALLQRTTASLAVVSEEELRAHMEAHRRLYERPGRLSFAQVFFSRQARGDAVEAEAWALLERLRQGEVTLEAAPRLGDPLPILGGSASRLISVVELERRLGASFAEAAGELEAEQWSEPIPSAYGLHLVFVIEREAGELPPLSAVREQLTRSLIHDRLNGVRASYLEQLRPMYDVRVVEVAESSAQPTEADEGAR